MTYTNYPQSWPDFVADQDSVSRTNGHQIDWANVPDAAPWQVTVGTRTFKMIRAGTVMSEQANGSLIPRTVGGTAACILRTDASEDSTVDALSGYGVIVGGVMLEDRMPDRYTNQDPTAGLAGAAFDTMKTELKANGVGFVFTTSGATIA